MQLQNLNKQYLAYLSKYPLRTKSVTAGTLAGLNEIIASIITRDFSEAKVGNAKIKHCITPKLLTMVFYGSFVVTPISDKLYGILNKIFKGPNLSRKMKILQIITSLLTITPLISGVFTSWLSIINGYRFPTSLKDVSIKHEICKILKIIRSGLLNNYLAIYKSSAITSLGSLIIAQNFIRPDLWIVFFSFVYFVLNTIQNTKLKLKQKRLKQPDE